MAEIQLLGLFYDVTQAADGIQALREQGVPDDQMEVMSGFPYNAEMLGRPKRKSRLGYISLGGAILGVLTALVLSAGLFLLYPLIQGGQPIVPIPPTLIVIFEVTMLGTMWSSFFGLLATNRHPRFREEIYDKRITEGSIGVAVEVADLMGDKAASALTEAHWGYLAAITGLDLPAARTAAKVTALAPPAPAPAVSGHFASAA